MSEEGADFGSAHFGGMVFVVNEDKTAHPIHISFFGTVGVVFEAEGFTKLVQEFFWHRYLPFAVRFGYTRNITNRFLLFRQISA